MPELFISAPILAPIFSAFVTSTTMASPSQPVNIRQVRLVNTESIAASIANSSAVGTPDLRSRRVLYSGTPPPPNIPPRALGIPTRTGSPAIPSAETPRSAGPSAIGPAETQILASLDLDDLPEDEKVKVLRRHLALNEERSGRNVETKSTSGSETEVPYESHSFGPQSRSSSSAGPFPIPYHVPGVDVT